MNIPKSPGGFDKICYGCNQLKCAQYISPSVQFPSNFSEVPEWIMSLLNYRADQISEKMLKNQGLQFHAQYGCQNKIQVFSPPIVQTPLITQTTNALPSSIPSTNINQTPTQTIVEKVSVQQYVVAGVCYAAAIGINCYSIYQDIKLMKKNNWSKKSIFKGTTNIGLVTGSTFTGALLGAKYGAVIGTAAGPIGTVVGSGIGALVGALTGFGLKKLLPWNW